MPLSGRLQLGGERRGGPGRSQSEEVRIFGAREQRGSTAQITLVLLRQGKPEERFHQQGRTAPEKIKEKRNPHVSGRTATNPDTDRLEQPRRKKKKQRKRRKKKKTYGALQSTHRTPKSTQPGEDTAMLSLTHGVLQTQCAPRGCVMMKSPGRWTNVVTRGNPFATNQVGSKKRSPCISTPGHPWRRSVEFNRSNFFSNSLTHRENFSAYSGGMTILEEKENSRVGELVREQAEQVRPALEQVFAAALTVHHRITKVGQGRDGYGKETTTMMVQHRIARVGQGWRESYEQQRRLTTVLRERAKEDRRRGKKKNNNSQRNNGSRPY